MESPLDVLLVDADADESEIEAAYRERVKEAHPDQGGSVEEFRAVRTAYEVLIAECQGVSPAADHDGSADCRGDRGRGGERGRAGGRGRARGRGRTGDWSDAGERNRAGDWGRAGDRYRSVTTRVTYLNYDAMSDFGWEADDDDLFGKAAAAGLDEEDYGQFDVRPGESLLEGAEDRGYAWPFACRGGACANCAVMVVDGTLSMPDSHVLPSELMERGIRLSCNGMPITDELGVVYNVKHMPELDELLLPPRPFEQAYPDD